MARLNELRPYRVYRKSLPLTFNPAYQLRIYFEASGAYRWLDDCARKADELAKENRSIVYTVLDMRTGRVSYHPPYGRSRHDGPLIGAKVRYDQ